VHCVIVKRSWWLTLASLLASSTQRPDAQVIY